MFLGLTAVIYFISFGVFTTYLPLFASGVALIETRKIGILFATRGIVQTITLIPLGRLADKVGKWLFMPVGLGCVALSMIGMALSRDFAMLLLSTIFFSLGSSLYQPTPLALLSQGIPVFWVGTAMGIFGVLQDAGLMIGSATGGVLWETLGAQAPFLASGIVVLIGVPVCLLGRRRWAGAAEAR